MSGVRDNSRRADLQRALGDRGTVHPRIFQGTMEHPAIGWYATIDGAEAFLGDHTGIGFGAIATGHAWVLQSLPLKGPA